MSGGLWLGATSCATKPRFGSSRAAPPDEESMNRSVVLLRKRKATLTRVMESLRDPLAALKEEERRQAAKEAAEGGY